MGERYDAAAKSYGMTRSEWLRLGAQARLKVSEKRKGKK